VKIKNAKSKFKPKQKAWMPVQKSKSGQAWAIKAFNTESQPEIINS